MPVIVSLTFNVSYCCTSFSFNWFSFQFLLSRPEASKADLLQVDLTSLASGASFFRPWNGRPSDEVARASVPYLIRRKTLLKGYFQRSVNVSGARSLCDINSFSLIISGPFHTNAFSFVNAYISMRLGLPFTLKHWAFSSKTLLKVDQNENACILCWSGRSKTHQNENGDRKGACVCSMRIEFHLRHNV